MIWCRTALKLGGIIGGLAQYRKPYLIFSVTKRNYWLFFALICFIFRQLTNFKHLTAKSRHSANGINIWRRQCKSLLLATPSTPYPLADDKITLISIVSS